MINCIADQEISGIKLSDHLMESAKAFVSELKNKKIIPKLAIIIVGNNPASEIYVRSKCKRAKEIGIDIENTSFKDNISQKHLVAKIHNINNDKSVNGILVQLPLPEHIDVNAIISSIDPKKDVDGFHPENIGKLAIGRDDGLFPCTPQGCMRLIQSVNPDIAGLDALMIGCSNIVGMPMQIMLLKNKCTVVTVHSGTKDMGIYVKNADIIISATGCVGLLSQHMHLIKKDAIIIDVGISRIEENGKNRIVGDIFDRKSCAEIKEKCAYITPVPGGVGPMTVIYLALNTIKAACAQNNISMPEALVE